MLLLFVPFYLFYLSFGAIDAFRMSGINAYLRTAVLIVHAAPRMEIVYLHGVEAICKVGLVEGSQSRLRRLKASSPRLAVAWPWHAQIAERSLPPCGIAPTQNRVLTRSRIVQCFHVVCFL